MFGPREHVPGVSEGGRVHVLARAGEVTGELASKVAT
jgi:hypothetical protein